jgi:hypothetical protein
MRVRLRRRGVDHGWFRPVEREPRRGDPFVHRGLVRVPDVRRDLRLLAGLRRGGDLAQLARVPRGFRFTGLSQNTQDPLELHKLHAEPGGLYVKVNWLSTWPGDGSLRLRFSYGAEILDDWRHDASRARLSLRLAEGLFPACRAVTRAVRRRFIQPIVYSNQPDGGALFHHDDVPGQKGVLFTQLAGRTAWLALPKRELMRHVREAGGRWGDRLLNQSPRFTRRLVDDGRLFVLEPGDAIELPSLARGGTAWHSVFCASRGGNLALSMGYR